MQGFLFVKILLKFYIIVFYSKYNYIFAEEITTKTNIMKTTLKNFGLALLLWAGLFTMQLLISNFI